MKTKDRFIMLPIFMLLVTVASTLWAAAPSVVYRTDVRPPTVLSDGSPGIFSTGFREWGENDDLEQHVDGSSLGREGADGSAFVATTTDLQFATGRFFTSLGAEFYVYEIRPTDNFYGVILTFESWGRSDAYYRELAEDYRFQAEYAAFGGIASDQIIRATRYTVVNGQAVRGNTVNNPSYQPAATVANGNPYPHRPPATNIWNPTVHCATSSSTHMSFGGKATNNAESVPFDEKMKSCYRQLSVMPAISVMMFTDQ